MWSDGHFNLSLRQLCIYILYIIYVCIYLHLYFSLALYPWIERLDWDTYMFHHVPFSCVKWFRRTRFDVWCDNFSFISTLTAVTREFVSPHVWVRGEGWRDSVDVKNTVEHTCVEVLYVRKLFVREHGTS
jgi:hypothetical protein